MLRGLGIRPTKSSGRGRGPGGRTFLLPKLSNGFTSKNTAILRPTAALYATCIRPAGHIFTLEERNELCVALVEIQLELHGYVNREVTGMGREKYLRRVGEFKN